MSKWVISLSGVKGQGPWSRGAFSGTADALGDAVAFACKCQAQDWMRERHTADHPHPHAKVFRLVRRKKAKPVSAPVPMFLTCPRCNARHIDEGEFATKPHHTHSCQGCGMTWRPAVVPTVGVEHLPGFKNETKADASPEERAVVEAAERWAEADGVTISNQDELADRSYRVVIARDRCLLAARALRAKRGG